MGLCGDTSPAEALLPHKGERDLPSLSWTDPSCFYVCSHAAMSRIFSSISAGPSMRIAPPKVNTQEKNGGVGATSTAARKWLLSTTSVATSSPKWSMTLRMVRFSHSSVTRWDAMEYAKWRQIPPAERYEGYLAHLKNEARRKRKHPA